MKKPRHFPGGGAEVTTRGKTHSNSRPPREAALLSYHLRSPPPSHRKPAHAPARPHRHCETGIAALRCYRLQTTGPTSYVLLVRPRTGPPGQNGGPFFATKPDSEKPPQRPATRRATTQPPDPISEFSESPAHPHGASYAGATTALTAAIKISGKEPLCWWMKANCVPVFGSTPPGAGTPGLCGPRSIGSGIARCAQHVAPDRQASPRAVPMWVRVWVDCVA